MLKQSVNRAGDVAARFGGDEFVILLPMTNALGAKNIADHIQQTIDSVSINLASLKISNGITVSIGCATLTPSHENSVEELIHRADEALYQAKALGKNQVGLSTVRQSES